MEGDCNNAGRRIVRCQETNRLEEDLWALAYEQVLPRVLRGVKRSRLVRSRLPRRLDTVPSPIIRSA